ncbi:MAG: DUF6318 family protein [Actinomycetaceae bacterium]|nr:DUF6318 family protein [Actinomycetaceae bacterium]
MNRLRSIGVGIVLVGVLVLAGCSSSDQQAAPSPTISYPPLESPSVAVSASPSVSQSPSLEGLIAQPEDPYPYPLPQPGEFIDENSQRGAEQFAFYYIEQLGYFNNTNDTSVMEPLIHEDCDRCRGSIKNIQDQYAAGSWAANLQYIPMRVWQYEETNADSGDTMVIVLCGEHDWISWDPGLSEPESHEAKRFFYEIHMRWDGRWRATQTWAKVEKD